jgi:tetratricopeptide (TPR) repeat protein
MQYFCLQMNKLYIFIVIILLGIGCASSIDKEYKPFEDLLASESFAPITDSIKQKPTALLFALRSAMSLKIGQDTLAWLDAVNAWKLEKTNLSANAVANVVMSTKYHKKYTPVIATCVQAFPNQLLYRRAYQLTLYNEKRIKEALVQNDTIFMMINNKEISGIDYFLQDRGKLCLEAGDTTNAILNLQKALQINPMYDDAAYELANIYAIQGNSKVITLCDQIITLDSLHEKCEPYYFKAVYYDNVNNTDDAIATINKAVQLRWTFIDGWLLLGDIYIKKNDLQQAENAFEKALTITKSNADAWYGLAQIAEKKGDKENANINYGRAYGFDNSLVEAKAGMERTK